MTAPSPQEAVQIVRGEIEPSTEPPTAFTPVYRLVTSNHTDVGTIAGEPVLHQLALTGNAPGVLVWGDRTFARGEERQLAGGVLEFEYVEQFAVFVVPSVVELWPVSGAGA